MVNQRSDRERLLAAFAAGTLLRPESPSVVDLARALATLSGVAEVAETPASIALADRIGSADHLVVILADGLGMNLIETIPESFLASRLAGELRTAFPSSSAVVLTSLVTGAWPAQHGVTGQWTYLPQIGASCALLSFTTRSGGKSLRDLGVTLPEAFPLPSTLAVATHDVVALYPESLSDSASSRYFSGGRARAGYRTLAEAADRTATRILAADRPTFTYLYAPHIDQEAHHYGVFHHQTRAAMLDLNREVERLAHRLGGRGRIVLTADHGLLDTPTAARHIVRPTTDLFDLLRAPPTGDSRVMLLHVRPGAEDEVRAWFHYRYGRHFFVLTTNEVEDLALLGPGPLAAATRARLGDLVVISAGVDVLDYVANRSGRKGGFVAHHSGLTPAEMRVPLVVG